MNEATSNGVPQAKLTLFRSVCIIVGVIVGSGIFRTPPDVAGNIMGWWNLSPALWVLAAWGLGGVISILGALCYAELATAYPQQGGDYVYLSRAYGPWSGFLFGWARLAIIQAGSIGAIAYVFGDYATELYALGPLVERTTEAGETVMVYAYSSTMYAVGGLVVFTVINIIGVHAGALTQNILTIVKVLGLLAVVGVAFFVAPNADAPAAIALGPEAKGNFGLALVLVLWAYGGWNEIAYVAAEVKDPRRNILRSLILGLAAVTVVYLIVNAAFTHVLGVGGMGASEAVAADVLKTRYGDLGSHLISSLVVISAAGALNGFIFTSPRVYYAMGKDHKVFGILGQWSKTLGTPVAALIAQCAIILALVVALVVRFGDSSGFATFVYFTGAAFWGFMILTGISLFVLRVRDRNVERPHKVIGFPVVPVLFVLSSLYMFWSSVTYKPRESLFATVILLAGLMLYWISRMLESGASKPPPSAE